MYSIDTFTLIDFILIFLSICIGVLFILFGADRLYKVYFGIIIGFLIFLIFNAQIEILEVIYFRNLAPFQEFLVKNKEFILGFFTCAIPVFGFFTALNTNIGLKDKPKLLTTIIFGTFLPFIFLGILAYISINSYVRLDFLRDILQFLSGSYLFYLLERNSSLVFFAILFLIFYKIIFSFFLSIFSSIYYVISRRIRGEEYYEEEEEDEYEEDEN